MKEDIMLLVGADMNDEGIIEKLIDMSEAYIKLYCGLNEVSEEFESVIVQMSVILYNRLGAEGETSHKEGEITRAFAQGMPQNIKDMLDRYRRGKIISL
ncbi:MAG: phage head-tail connector protein [Firmicutes bacterium]|nr:phage head-tail connector protein [Bacillota bacterium]